MGWWQRLVARDGDRRARTIVVATPVFLLTTALLVQRAGVWRFLFLFYVCCILIDSRATEAGA